MATRLQKTAKSAVVGIGAQLISLLLQFAVRATLIWGLGEYYLGLNSVMTSLIGMYSLAELGLGNAIIYSLYRPLAEGDKGKVEAYLSLYKKVYRVIGMLVGAVAAAMIPFLGFFINGAVTTDVYVIYALFTGNAVLGYVLFNYRTALFQANQERYLISYADTVFVILSSCGQIIAFVLFHDYIAGLVVLVVSQCIRSLFIRHVSKKRYAEIDYASRNRLSQQDKAALVKNVYAMMLGRLSDTASASIPALAISSGVSLAASGLYSNYTMITSAIMLFMRELFGSVTPSVGNFNIDSTPGQKEDIYNTMNFVAFCCYGLCAVCCFVGMNPFIEALFGQAYVLDMSCVAGLSANLLSIGLLHPTVVFKDGCGVFFPGRFRPLVSCILTVLLAFLLVGPFGVAGVAWALVLSRLLTANWYDPFLVYKLVFKKGPWKYYGRTLGYLAFIAALALICFVAGSYLGGPAWLRFLENVLMAVVVVIAGIALVFHRSKGYKESIALVKALLDRRGK